MTGSELVKNLIMLEYTFGKPDTIYLGTKLYYTLQLYYMEHLWTGEERIYAKSGMTGLIFRGVPVVPTESTEHIGWGSSGRSLSPKAGTRPSSGSFYER